MSEIQGTYCSLHCAVDWSESSDYNKGAVIKSHTVVYSGEFSLEQLNYMLCLGGVKTIIVQTGGAGPELEGNLVGRILPLVGWDNIPIIRWHNIIPIGPTYFIDNVTLWETILKLHLSKPLCLFKDMEIRARGNGIHPWYNEDYSCIEQWLYQEAKI